MTVLQDIAAHFDHQADVNRKARSQTAWVQGVAFAFVQAAEHVREVAKARAYQWDDVDDDLQAVSGSFRAIVEVAESATGLRPPVYEWRVRFEQWSREDGLDYEDVAEGTVYGDWSIAVASCEAVLLHFDAVAVRAEAEMDEAILGAMRDEEAYALAAGAVNPEDLS